MNVQATYENNRLVKLEAELETVDSHGRHWLSLAKAIVQDNPNRLLSDGVRYNASGIYYTEVFNASTDMNPRLWAEFIARAEKQQEIISAIMDAYAMHEQFHKIQEQLQKGG